MCIRDRVYALDLDPRRVRFGLLEGWDREQDAYQDSAALAYVSGPMYERHVDDDGREITVPLGDLKFGKQVWRGRNRTASRQRAYVGIRHDGSIDFSYGELTDERSRIYDTFIGGLHSLYNDIEAPRSRNQCCRCGGCRRMPVGVKPSGYDRARPACQI